MKKSIILCSLLAIAPMNAMNKPSVQDDDNDKNSLLSIAELSEELDDATEELTKCQIRVSVLEQILRAVPAMKDVDFRKGISMTPAPEAKALHRGIIKKQLAHDPKIIGDYEEDYINASMRLVDLNHEVMVLRQLQNELESHMDIIARTSKQRAAPAAEESQSSNN